MLGEEEELQLLNSAKMERLHNWQDQLSRLLIKDEDFSIQLMVVEINV